MDTVFVYCLVAAVLAGLVSVIVNIAINEGEGTIGAGFWAAAIAGIAEFVLLYSMMPTFAHWSSAGYFLTGVVVLTSAAASTLIAEAIARSHHGSNLNGSFVIVFLGFLCALLFWLASWLSVPSALINNQEWDEIAALLNVQDPTPEELAEASSDSDLIKFTAAAAGLEASANVPNDIGSYAKIGSTLDQVVNGQEVFVTDLNVSNWPGFRKEGSALPGYFIRPAKDVDAATTFVSGYSMQYVPQARYLLDLNRHVYLNYTISCGCEIDGLDNLEIDDQGQPKYTATVWRYTIGNVGMEATHVIVVDPENGKIESEYLIDEAPEWIEQNYSIEKIEERAKWWATYSEWDKNWGWQNLSGKMKVDAIEHVYGPDGRRYYMTTITSVGSDDTLIWELRTDPRTGRTVQFAASGNTLTSVRTTIEESTFDLINPSVGAEPIECERQKLLGVNTYYCILQSRSNDRGAIVGYAFLQERYGSQPAQVIIATTFNEAWDLFRRQITEGGGGNAEVQGESGNLFVVTGTLMHKADYPNDEGMIVFLVSTRENPRGVYFQVSQNNEPIALGKVGHKLEITAFDLRVDQTNDVLSVVNLSLPPVTPTP